jgi:hypothetical protein
MLTVAEGFYRAEQQDGAASDVLEPVSHATPCHVFLNIEEWVITVVLKNARRHHRMTKWSARDVVRFLLLSDYPRTVLGIPVCLCFGYFLPGIAKWVLFSAMTLVTETPGT